MRRVRAFFLGNPPPWPVLRFFGLVGVAWALLAVALSPTPAARTALVAVYVAVWACQAARPWRIPPVLVPWTVLGVLLLLAAAPSASDPGGFRPFPFAEGTYADGALAVATAPAWAHLAILARTRDLAWCVPAALALAPARHLAAAGLPLWPAWLLWGTGFLLLGLAFRLHAALYEARLRLDREAVAEERRKIAREVHDLVGHGLGVVLLNIGAARLATARGDAPAALAALAEAERVGRRGVRDVHQGLVLLRDPAPAGRPIAPPPPTAEDIAALVGELRAGGLAVDLTTRGDLASVDPAVGLALYRVVQEALANAARHAPGSSAAVAVGVDGPLALVTVTDGGAPPGAGRPAGGGLGLVGMRERVTALGGTLRAGPHGTGWRVEAAVPAGGAR
ncbi:sensor histidine kinase [Actinomadura opuntiae]|uniref:sensor histidine kinase n=1 Tax=Actinomadura sp. OS1-43 TaxID=604315 RepID=UPI00255B1792|nr:histidine kinase [Actinomadura sp. OS1-43]MDL4815540.1 histidine kinase [Actinomadura sp. OS1-43]